MEQVLGQKTADLQGRGTDDESELLMEILNALPRGQKSTIAKMLDDTGWDHEAELALAGIKKYTEEGMVCFAYKVIERNVPLSPRWTGKDLVDFLERVPGAEPRKRVRYGKLSNWAVRIPWNTARCARWAP